MSKTDKIDAQIDALREEKKLAKLEEDFTAKKLDGKATQADREKLREARQSFRENHRTPKTGAAVSSIGAKAKTEEAG